MLTLETAEVFDAGEMTALRRELLRPVYRDRILSLRIGGNAPWGEYVTGQIDDVRIYNRALSQAEIQTDMNTPVP